MKKIVFFGGSSLLAVNWASRIAHDYTVYLIMHKRLIDLPNVNCVVFEDDFEASLGSFFKKNSARLYRELCCFDKCRSMRKRS